MTQIKIQLWDKLYPYIIDWIYDITNIKIGDIIYIKNDKQKINGYNEKLSELIIEKLANNSRNIMEYYDFIKFAKETININKFTKKFFNLIPFFKFKILDIYYLNNEIILVVNPMNIENDYETNKY